MYEAPCLRAMHRLMAVQHVKKREVTSFNEITLGDFVKRSHLSPSSDLIFYF